MKKKIPKKKAKALGSHWGQLIVYNTPMAKRATGIGKRKKTRSRKTKKRLAIKQEMLAKKASKRRK